MDMYPTKPKSICTCGHTGDGEDSQHEGQVVGPLHLNNGHGSCKVKGCDCQQFTWKEFLPWFEERLQTETN